MRSVPAEIAALDDVRERFRLSELWTATISRVKPGIAVQRQDAFREFKELFGLTLEAAAEVLGITFGAARRIANAKLNRDEPGE